MGWVAAAARGSRLVATSLPARRAQTAVAALGIEADLPAGRQAGLPASHPLLIAFARDLARYFAGEPVDFRQCPVDLSDRPPFHRRALAAARRIPYGEVRSYRWVACAAGSPGAWRAAGQAMSHNPLPLIIPCHRVVAADGGLGGFGGGMRLKRALLVLEGLRAGAAGARPV